MATKRKTKPKSFIQLCIDGKVKPEDIDAYIHSWHQSESGSEGCEIHEYLGFTEDEYARYVEHTGSEVNIVQNIIKDRIKAMSRTYKKPKAPKAASKGRLKDSGERTDYDTGAVREPATGKGRYDLLPLKGVAEVLSCSTASAKSRDKIVTGDYVFEHIAEFQKTGCPEALINLICEFIEKEYNGNYWEAIRAIAVQMEDGAKKYSDRNWEKGLPVSRFMDSAMRHYSQFKNNETDEPHVAAFLWNIICGWATLTGVSKIHENWYK